MSTGTLNWTPGKADKEKEPESPPPVPPLPQSLHRYNSVTVSLPNQHSDEGHAPVTSPRRPLPKPPLRIPTPQTDTTSRTSSILVNVSAIDINGRPVPSAVASSGHFVKNSSKITLVLGGEEGSTGQPTYSSGSVIEGILAVPRPSGLLSIEIKVRPH